MIVFQLGYWLKIHFYAPLGSLLGGAFFYVPIEKALTEPLRLGLLGFSILIVAVKGRYRKPLQANVCADVQKRRFFMLANQLPCLFMPSRASFLPTPWHTSLHPDDFLGRTRVAQRFSTNHDQKENLLQLVVTKGFKSGGYRARTGDLLAASQTLSQLS